MCHFRVSLTCSTCVTASSRACDSCSAGAPAALPSRDIPRFQKLQGTVKALGDMEFDGPVLSPLDGNVKRRQQVSEAATTTTDTESGIFPGEGDLCVEHEAVLDWFCGTERKLVCSYCTVVGTCQGHIVTPLADRVTAVRVSFLTIEACRTCIKATIAF